MNKKVLLGAGLIIGSLFVGWITFTGYFRAKNAERLTEAMPITTVPAVPSTNDNWIESDACRLTSGTDAYAYCFGPNPNHDKRKVEEALKQVRQCALDAIATVQRITQNLIDEDDVIEVLCGMAGHYPESSEGGEDLDLNTGMQTLINDYVWK